MSINKKKITCPQCGKPGTWDMHNPFRPFCCERCKLIDLGAWAAEEHRIPSDPVSPDEINSDDGKELE